MRIPKIALMHPILLCLFVLVSSSWQNAICAEQLELPTKIVLTAEDVRSLNTDHTLRGRSVWRGCSSGEGSHVWEGIQVFTGKKSDVLAWFEGEQKELSEVGGFQNMANARSWQYDLLVSQLTQTGDLDILRTLIWHAQSTSDYVAPDWRALVENPKLTVAERLVAWGRYCRTSMKVDRKPFWKLLRQDITTDDIVVAASRQPSYFDWSVFHVAPEVDKSLSQHIENLLKPMIRREYLGLDKGYTMIEVLSSLRSCTADQGTFSNDILGKLEAWDKLGDARSTALWNGLKDLDAYDHEVVARIRKFAVTAKVPANAHAAFNWYLHHPGLEASQKAGEDPVGKLFHDYFVHAFAEGDAGYDFLHYLAIGDNSNASAGSIGLLKVMCQYEVQLEVTPEQMKILAGAWETVPEALKIVRTKE